MMYVTLSVLVVETVASAVNFHILTDCLFKLLIFQLESVTTVASLATSRGIVQILMEILRPATGIVLNICRNKIKNAIMVSFLIIWINELNFC